MRTFLAAGLLLFTLGAAACSGRAAAARSWNEALAALAAGDAQAAEISAERAAAIGGGEFPALRDFLLASAAFGRSLAAETLAGIPGAALSSYDRALAAAEESRRAFLRALRARAEDWPAARRNLERVQARIVHLQSLRDAALRDPAASRPPPPPPESPAGSERLLERLGQLEQQKRVLRRASASPAPGAVEQDW